MQSLQHKANVLLTQQHEVQVTLEIHFRKKCFLFPRIIWTGFLRVLWKASENQESTVSVISNPDNKENF